MDGYRSLVAWQVSHQLAVRTLRALDCAYHPRALAVFGQLRRAVVSVEANIVEGYALDTPAYFTRHLRIAKGSVAEAHCLIRLASELGYIADDVARELEPLADRCERTLRGLIRKYGVATPHAAPRTPHR